MSKNQYQDPNSHTSNNSSTQSHTNRTRPINDTKKQIAIFNKTEIIGTRTIVIWSRKMSMIKGPIIITSSMDQANIKGGKIRQFIGCPKNTRRKGYWGIGKVGWGRKDRIIMRLRWEGMRWGTATHLLKDTPQEPTSPTIIMFHSKFQYTNVRFSPDIHPETHQISTLVDPNKKESLGQ